MAVKIEHAVYQSAKMYGRHFDDKDEVLSHITRQSIDVLKVSAVLNPIFVLIYIFPRRISRLMSPTKSGCLSGH